MNKIVAAILALCLAMSVCAALADGAIKISTIGPLTGDYAAYGKAVANALLKEFRAGRMGRFTLETPPERDAPQPEEDDSDDESPLFIEE